MAPAIGVRLDAVEPVDGNRVPGAGQVRGRRASCTLAPAAALPSAADVVAAPPKTQHRQDGRAAAGSAAPKLERVAPAVQPRIDSRNSRQGIRVAGSVERHGDTGAVADHKRVGCRGALHVDPAAGKMIHAFERGRATVADGQEVVVQRDFRCSGPGQGDLSSVRPQGAGLGVGAGGEVACRVEA